MKRIAITGSIGAGKSTVGQIVKRLGFPLYDCDAEAKRIMATDRQVISDVKAIFGTDIYVDGLPDRQRIAAIVFSDHDKLAALNKAVHAAVREDIGQWLNNMESLGHKAAFVETAIFNTARLANLFNEAWWVEAPTDTRMKRVTASRPVSEEEFNRRDRTQRLEKPAGNRVTVINNDDRSALLPVVKTLLEKL